MDATDLPPTTAACDGLIESAPDALLVVDGTGTIRVVNERAERLFGYDRGDLLGQGVQMLVSERATDAYVTLRKGFCSPSRRSLPSRVELIAQRRDGTPLTADVALSEVDLGGSTWVAATVRDLVRPAASPPTDVASLLSEAQEAERRRIADDIHDDSIQVLTAVMLRLHQLRRRVGDSDVLDLLGRVEADLELATQRLRRLAFALNPRVLDSEGLAAALRTLVSELTEDASISGVVDDRELGYDPPPATRRVLYRIAREALTNVRKHSGATHVRVGLETSAGGWMVTIEDDGSGIAVEDRDEPTHFGLPAMRERAEAAGGWLSVETAAGKGSIVTFWVPEEQA